jgi:GrpB-like predicted nucleotidyltransferase (UPF0157 family)
MQVRIELCDYDPVWPRLYAREAARIRSALGERVVRLEHVGSTSVPGLAAKPLIDIVLEVPDAAEEAAYLAAMEAVGMCCGFGSVTGSSTGSSKARTPTSTCMCSQRAALSFDRPDAAIS